MANNTYKNIDTKTKCLINTKLNIKELLAEIDYTKAPDNIKFLIKTANCKNNNDVHNMVKKYKLKFPIRKLLIVEGITEEILLPVLAKKIKNDFNSKGIYILGAGGKSKSPAIYSNLKDKLKIPIILLFDSDAENIQNNLKKELKKGHKALIIQNGEFEDILSLNLIKRSLNNEYKPITKLTKEELSISSKMCNNIEQFYKSRHLGEYKKSKVAKILSENIKYNTDITNEIHELIKLIT